MEHPDPTSRKPLRRYRSRLAGTASSGDQAAPVSLRDELHKRDAFEQIEQEAYLSIARTASHLTADFEALFGEFGLSNPLYNVLRIVAGHGKTGVPSQRIGQDLVSKGPDVTRLVDRLARLGLVERVSSPEDRRVTLVRILPAGQRLLRKIKPGVKKLHAEQFRHMAPDQLRDLCDLLFLARHPEHADAAPKEA